MSHVEKKAVAARANWRSIEESTTCKLKARYREMKINPTETATIIENRNAENEANLEVKYADSIRFSNIFLWPQGEVEEK